MGKYFKRAIENYDTLLFSRRILSQPSDDFQKWHRKRFISMLSLIKSLIDHWDLQPFITRDGPVNLVASRGFYFGICPLCTLDAVSETREDNPASLMYMAGETEEELRWLLVTTDAAGRCEDLQGKEFPILRGVRVFNSVMGKPNDRINFMQNVMNKKSVNVAGVIAELHQIAAKAETEL